MKFTEAKRKINLRKNGLLQKVPNSKNWLVLSEFFWILDYEDKEHSEIIIVPKNFITDFGSIPRFLWGFFNPTRYVAYILHDFLYSKKYIPSALLELPENKKKKNKFFRKRADLILKEALKVEGMGKIRRNIIYFAVRIFGKKYFRK